MKRFIFFSILVIFQAGVLACAESEVKSPLSADAYATCAACHLARGEGIPGGFPPIRNRAAAIARLEGGREYLITVVSFGLMGQLQVDNTTYFGVMPGNQGSMSAEQIAAALNYSIFELIDDKSKVAGIKSITADEVSFIQSQTTAGSPNTAATLRKKLVDGYGDEWVE